MQHPYATIRALFPFVLIIACSSPGNEMEGEDPSTRRAAEPGLYAGLMPCADCSGIRTELQLWPHGGCALQRMYQGKPDGGGPFVEWGRWRMDGKGRLELSLGEAGEKRHFHVDDAGGLVAYAAVGGALLDAATNTLAPTAGAFTPRVSGTLKGTFYQPRPRVWHFRECQSGRSMLVRFDPAAADIESGFREAGGVESDGLVVLLSGTLAPTPLTDEQGPVTLLTIMRWDRFLPGERCPF